MIKNAYPTCTNHTQFIIYIYIYIYNTSQDYSGAFKSYDIAIKLLERTDPSEASKVDPKTIIECKELMTVLYNNKCQVQITMKAYDKAKDVCKIIYFIECMYSFGKLADTRLEAYDLVFLFYQIQPNQNCN